MRTGTRTNRRRSRFIRALAARKLDLVRSQEMGLKTNEMSAHPEMRSRQSRLLFDDSRRHRLSFLVALPKYEWLLSNERLRSRAQSTSLEGFRANQPCRGPLSRHSVPPRFPIRPGRGEEREGSAGPSGPGVTGGSYGQSNWSYGDSKNGRTEAKAAQVTDVMQTRAD